jgi:hypothetical protein
MACDIVSIFNIQSHPSGMEKVYPMVVSNTKSSGKPNSTRFKTFFFF